MSNRMITSYRIPMITDPVIAGQAGAAFAASRARTEQAVRTGQNFALLLTPLYAFLTALGEAIDQALEARALFSLTDAQLAARGIDRAGIPGHIWKR